MKPHNRTEMTAARRKAGEELSKLGLHITRHTTAKVMAGMIANHTGWAAPPAGSLCEFLERFIESRSHGLVAAPYRPVVRKPLSYDRTMREAAIRAAAVQPPMVHAVSNVVTWRETPI
ncbi:hypothetical protein [Achromobacter sp. PAB15]|uniref:hypothetical protein n=1 Tax=Achromobacter sp. PAB15 TaxID=3233048 RepID=UPI003F8F12F4